MNCISRYRAPLLRVLLAAGTAMGAVTASPAWGQDSPVTTPAANTNQNTAPHNLSAPDAASVSEVVVTAQFRRERLQDVPLSITAVNSALLEQRSQTNITQVALQAPNVTLIPAGAVFGPSIGAEIRGVGQFDFNPAYEPGVGLYIDDVYYATLTGGVFDLLDLDRVEILRGPQGTLTGRNSEGGAIKLYSKKPDDSGASFFEGTYGSRNRVDLRAGADFVLADGLYARFSGAYKQQDGYVNQIDYGCAHPNNTEGVLSTRTAANCLVAKLGEVNQGAVRGQIRYHPSKILDWTVSADYSNEDHTDPAEVTTFSKNPDFLCGRFCTYADFRTYAPNATNSSNRSTFKGGGVSSNAVVTLSDDLSATSITAYRKYVSSFGTDDDFSPNPVLAAEGDNILHHHFFSEELRLNGRYKEWAEYTVGGFYSDQKTTYFTRQDIRYIVPGVPFQFFGNDPVAANSEAAYGTVILRPMQGLTLTGGLRYTEESKDYTFHRLAYDGGPVTGLAAAFGLGALDGLTAKYKGSRLDYRGSIDYRFSPALLAYATYSTGFKGGGVTARPFTATQALDGNFSPETLDNYEAGVKSDLFDRRLRLNVSAFIDKYSKVQLAISDCSAVDGISPDPFPCGAVANAGNATFKGVEAEVSAEPVHGLNFDGSLSYLTSKWDTLSKAVGGNVTLADPATSAPVWKASGGVQYRADLGDAGSVTPRFDIAYNDEMYQGRALGHPYFLPAYTLANLRLTWQNTKRDMSVSGEITNLFDKYYYNAIFSAVYAFTGTAYEQVARPREWAVTFKKTF